MPRIKHVIFVSQSHLAHNVIEILSKTLTKRVDLTCFTTLNDLAESAALHPVNLVILDHNTFAAAGSEHTISLLLGTRSLKHTYKILLHKRDDVFDSQLLQSLGFVSFLTKPFLPEELTELMQKCLKG